MNTAYSTPTQRDTVKCSSWRNIRDFYRETASWSKILSQKDWAYSTQHPFLSLFSSLFSIRCFQFAVF